MMRDDELMESVALLALGVLGVDEARAVEQAMASDEGLREEYRRLRATADLLGYAAEAPTVDDVAAARMKRRLRQAIAPDVRPARPRGVAWVAWGAAAAGFALAVLAGSQNAGLRDELKVAHETSASLQAQVAAQTKRADEGQGQLADLLAPDAKRYAVAGGEVVQRGGRIYIAMRDLPKLPKGKVFQAWTLATGAKAVAPSITFTSSAGGSVVVALPEQPKHLAAIAVSVEPEGGSRAPTTKPLWVRPLS
jgi:anti-sigma-K factor RskA